MKEDNQAVIKALNMYGRVPKMWELLEEIERLNNIINKAIKRSDELADEINEAEGAYSNLFLEIEEILKGADR